MLSKREQLARALIFATTVSGILVGNIGIGYWLGVYADNYFIIYPYGKMLGIILGMIAAVWSVYLTLKKLFQKKDD